MTVAELANILKHHNQDALVVVCVRDLDCYIKAVAIEGVHITLGFEKDTDAKLLVIDPMRR